MAAETDESKVKQLMELGGLDHDFARSLLESNGWDVQAAANVIFGGGGEQPDAAGPAASTSTSTSSSSRKANGATSSSSSNHPLHRPFSTMPSSAFASEDDSDFETGVRAADPARMDQLFQGPQQSRQTRGVHEPFRDYSEEWTKSRRSRNLAKLYEPPKEMIYRGDLDELCAAAQQRGLWVLINIQAVKEFRSHVLNRDLWRDEKLKALIQRHFLFWQKDADSQSGQLFSTYYRINRRFPYICIVDPRTREELAHWTSEKDQELDQFMNHMKQFLDQHGTLSGGTLNQEEKAIADLTEEELMRRAISESLKKPGEEAQENGAAEETSEPEEPAASPTASELENHEKAVARDEGYRPGFLNVDVPPMLKVPPKPKENGKIAVSSNSGGSAARRMSITSSHGSNASNSKKRKLDSENGEEDSESKPPPSKREKPTVPPEPAADADGVTTIKIRAPGAAITRRFLRTDTIQTVADFVSIQPNVSHRLDAGEKFVLVTPFPKQRLDDTAKTLEACGLLNSQIVVEWE